MIARVVHEAIRAYQAVFGEAAAAPWDEAEAWQRQITIAGVRFRLANPKAPAAALHDLWVGELRGLGWTYGAVKDAHAKTHPSLVAFNELPPREQRKDELFGAIVAALGAFDQGVAAARKPT